MAFPTDWGRRCAIVIDNTNVDGNLSNFPVLVHATGGAYNGLPEEMFDADGDNPAIEGGGDIRFSSDEAGSSQLACEVVAFHIDNDPSNGYAAIYVNVPSVTAASTTTIYVWYDKSGESQPARDAAYGMEAVWDSNFKMVHHMVGASATALDDSTSNNNDVTGDGGSPDYNQTGKIYKAVNFTAASDEYLGIPDANSIDFPNQVFIELWLKTSSGSRMTVVEKGYEDYEIAIEGADLMCWYGSGAAWKDFNITAGSSVSDGTWHHYAYWIDKANGVGEAWIDGETEGTDTNDALSGNQDKTLYIGGRQNDTGQYFTGLIEEVRLSAINRDDNWTKATFHNLDDPGTFCVEGTPESTAVGVTVTPSAQTGTFSAVAVVAIILSSVLSPSAVAGTFTAQSPTIIYDHTVSLPAAQAGTFSQPAPAVVTDQILSPSVQTITASVISPSITGDANISPSVQTATFSVQSVQYAEINPLTGVYTFSQPSSMVTGGAVAGVAVQTLAFSLPTVVTPKQAIIQPLVGTYIFSLPTPTVIIEHITVSPSVQDITASQPTITITTDQVLSPSAQVGIFSQPEISFVLDYVESVGVQDAIFSLQAPFIYTDEDVTIQVTTQTASFSLPEESVVSENILSVAVQDVTTSLPAVSITGYGLVSPDAQAGTFAAQSPTITGDSLVSLDAQDATFSLVQPTITLISVVSVDAQTLTFSLPSGTYGAFVTILPSVQDATFSQPTPTASGGSLHAPVVQTATFTMPTPIISVPDQPGFFLYGRDFDTNVRTLNLKEIATPSEIANYGRLYVKSDGLLYFLDEDGNEYTITMS